LLRGPPRFGRFSVSAAGAPLPVARRGFLRRLSVGLCLPEEGRGSPRLLGRPLVTCRGQRPRQTRRRLALLSTAMLLPSGLTNPWALGIPTVSRLYSHGPRLRVPTHRRRASLPPGARLATGLPGSALAGRVSHPLDDFSEFHELPHVFIPFRPALPGRTVSEFVGGSREAESVWGGEGRSACRGPRTLTQAAHASRGPLVAHATATAHASRSGLSRKVARPCWPAEHPNHVYGPVHAPMQP